MKLEILKLKIQKFFTNWFHKWAYKNIPFGICFCELAESYENYPVEKDQILAEFDVPAVNRHYLIIKEKNL